MQLTVLTTTDRRFPLSVLEALRQRRITLGMTQRETAERIRAIGGSTHQSTVAGWETGSAHPSPDLMAMWAEALGVRVVVGLQEIPRGDA